VPKVITFGDPTQNDANVHWFALDPLHASYAATEATLSAASASLPSGYGTYAVAAGGNGYTGLNICGPTYGLNGQTISASGVCRDIVNYSKCVVPHYAAPSTRTNAWGDSYNVYGQTLQAPTRLTTDGYDRLIAHMKGTGSDTVMFVAQTATGDASGDSYLNACAVKDTLNATKGSATKNTAAKTLVVLCGNLSRFKNEGSAASLIYCWAKTGSSTTRTAWLAHSIDGARPFGGRKMASGSGSGTTLEDADWTFDSDGTWFFNHGSAVLDATSQFFVLDENGDPLTKVASIAACKALPHSYYPQSTITYCHRTDGANPRLTTFWDIGSTANGVHLGIAGTEFVDFYGIEFPQQSWRGTLQTFYSDMRFMACKFKFAGLSRLFCIELEQLDGETGQLTSTSSYNSFFTAQAPANMQWLGCEFAYQNSVVYDVIGHSKCPNNYMFRDCYFHHNGAIAYGIDCGDNDSHTLATLGSWDNYTIRNNRFDNCCFQTVVIYTPDVSVNLFDGDAVLTDGAITNGTFDTDITGWTNLSTGTGAISWSSGKIRLAPGASGTAKAEQAVTIGAGYLTIEGTAGTSASPSGGNRVLTLDGSPDLSNLITAAGNTQSRIYFAHNLSGFEYAPISAFDNVAKTVTVQDTFKSGAGAALTLSSTYPWKIGKPHVLKFVMGTPDQSITVTVGTSTGAADIKTKRADGSYTAGAVTVRSNPQTGVAAVAFLPTATTVYIQFSSTSNSNFDIDNIELLTTLGGQTDWQEALPLTNRYTPDNYHYFSMVVNRDFDWSYNLFTNPLTIADQPAMTGGEGQCFSFNGNQLVAYGDAVRNIKVLYNRVEGAFDSVVRNKWAQHSPYTAIEVGYNTIRGATSWAFRDAGAPQVGNGGTALIPSVWFHHNDVHATGLFVLLLNPAGGSHLNTFHNNTWRNDDGADWRIASTTYTTLPLWGAAATGSDTYDTDSTHVPL
jgi:hypothetical protein